MIILLLFKQGFAMVLSLLINLSTYNSLLHYISHNNTMSELARNEHKCRIFRHMCTSIYICEVGVLKIV